MISRMNQFGAGVTKAIGRVFLHQCQLTPPDNPPAVLLCAEGQK